MLEKDFQAKALRWLKSKGCVVLKIQAGPGVPNGFPDCLVLYEGSYLALEFKRSKHARFQPGQKQWLEKLDSWSYARAVSPDNWEEVKKELEEWLK